MMRNRRALIIGGGIGGPVAAVALERAGIQATVYEASDAPADDVGLFLNTSSNGLDVLRTLDVDAAGRADGFRIPRSVFWSSTGKRLGQVANGIRLRDLVMPLALKRFANPRAHAWLYTYHVDWQEKVA
jgi:FAD-dependent urate hydroxylase